MSIGHFQIYLLIYLSHPLLVRPGLTVLAVVDVDNDDTERKPQAGDETEKGCAAKVVWMLFKQLTDIIKSGNTEITEFTNCNQININKD